ncbi:MAG TPA: flagellar protein FlbB [Xanthobacteraceae bacterium]|nr:flagellar protein FlbB [Xanthobacteraceae bacterium]
MKRLIRDFRVLPVVVFAVACLLALKLIGLAVDGGYIFAGLDQADQTGSIGDVASDIETIPAGPAQPLQRSWAQEIFDYPATTGSAAAGNPAEKKEESKAPPKGPPDGKVAQIDGPRQLSAGEKAVLERLQERRQELDARARELEIRENLLKAAEQRLESKAAEIKAVEGSNAAAVAKREEADAAKFKNIVTMYENMKPKDAAKIFDRLDKKVLIEVAWQFNPRKLSEVMAAMQPESAEKLTVEMASRANGSRSLADSDLPKIEGRPNGT